jgi:putative membrane protein
MGVPSFLLTSLALHGPADFSWTQFEVHISTLIGCALLAGLYFWGTGPLRRRHGWAERASRGQAAWFVAGLAVLFLALNGPIHDLSDNYLFSAHMVQHMLLTLVVPPLLLVGTPAWLLRPLLRAGVVRRTAEVVTLPLTAFAIYNVVFAGWHVPVLYNAALMDHNTHIVQHLTFIAAAVLMWWPVAGSVPELGRSPGPMQVIYLFAFGIPMSIVAALITLSDRVLYPFYEAAPRVWNLSPLDDQQLGGLIMWIPGGLVVWIAITVAFFRWANREERLENRARRLAHGTD